MDPGDSLVIKPLEKFGPLRLQTASAGFGISFSAMWGYSFDAPLPCEASGSTGQLFPPPPLFFRKLVIFARAAATSLSG